MISHEIYPACGHDVTNVGNITNNNYENTQQQWVPSVNVSPTSRHEDKL